MIVWNRAHQRLDDQQQGGSDHTLSVYLISVCTIVRTVQDSANNQFVRFMSDRQSCFVRTLLLTQAPAKTLARADDQQPRRYDHEMLGGRLVMIWGQASLPGTPWTRTCHTHRRADGHMAKAGQCEVVCITAVHPRDHHHHNHHHHYHHHHRPATAAAGPPKRAPTT